MDVLRENVKKLKPTERYCSILFDEMCLSSGLNYKSSSDIIDGFIDTGVYRSQKFGDHVLVFMIRGIKKKFKQPICYTFCQGATKQDELVRQLKEVICEVHKTGLRVVATISDQGRANEGAINIMRNDTRKHYISNNLEYRNDYYEVEVAKGEYLQIVHLFDVPHLMKCIRNNLITKDLTFSTNGIKKTAKWEHLIQLYQADSFIPDCKMLPRLTDAHVIPEKIPKMKVRNACQVFSQRVSAIMNFLASKSIIDPGAADTAEIFLFFDKLFDSLNGSFDKVVDGKIFRTSVKKNSIHHQLWMDSLKVLSTMKFVNKNGKAVSIPTIKNWEMTIKGFQTLSKALHIKGIQSLLPRVLNQDSLENLFGGIRSVGCSNPTCSIFMSSYKTLLLNNLVSSHSPGANCEDFTEGCLLTYKNLFSIRQETPEMPLLSCDLPEQVIPNQLDTTQYLRDLTHTFISGYIIKKINTNLLKNCKTCLKLICSNNTSSENYELLQAREYQPSRPSLKYTAPSFGLLVSKIIVNITQCLPSVCHHPKILQFL
ncbi:unnamed protein product [Macrosiphum euphorbiae]|uniref:Transposable element P transposase n=1 Tax=Macrosiphum euphorbiae TaxID=13131 RepID=A0AAV0YA51_9HEMI|nr:unnamed protein product [Macrosiphum euphorbiae]